MSQYRAEHAVMREGVTTIPKGSRGKCSEVQRTLMLGCEIVWSIWRHIAARMGGIEVTNQCEHFTYKATERYAYFWHDNRNIYGTPGL